MTAEEPWRDLDKQKGVAASHLHVNQNTLKLVASNKPSGSSNRYIVQLQQCGRVQINALATWATRANQRAPLWHVTVNSQSESPHLDTLPSPAGPKNQSESCVPLVHQ